MLTIEHLSATPKMAFESCQKASPAEMVPQNRENVPPEMASENCQIAPLEPAAQNKLPDVVIEKMPQETVPQKVTLKPVPKIEFSPVVPAIYFQEALLLEAAKQGLKVSEKYTKRKRRRRENYPLTYANCSWFYSGKESRKPKSREGKGKKPFRVTQKKLMPSKRLLISAHQASIYRMKKNTEMYEVEYIGDFKIVKGQRFYLVKWVGWPEEANTWEASQNLSCHILIKEFHEDYQRQLEDFFVEKKISWNLLLFGQNGIHEATYTQRLFDAIPKTFKYLSTYSQLKAEFRNKLKQWQDEINASSQGFPFVVVENEVDLESPPKEFTYVSQNMPGEGVTIPNDPIIGCECSDKCNSASGSCSCSTNAYQRPRTLYESGLIKVRPGSPIYECNSRCTCGPECPNRVVQKGSTYTLAIFRTANGKGWGVKALQAIPRGAFVIEYIGEVITNIEAEKRGLEYDVEGITYLFDLDYHDTENPMTVDATRYGNVSHFVNHSCSPNLQVYNVFIDNMDLALPRIALFARRNIQVNEEITFDYQMTGASGDFQDDVSDVPSDNLVEIAEKKDEICDRQSEVSDTSRTSSILKKKCLCNATNCRGWLVM